MKINLELDDTSRVVETVPADGIEWEQTGSASAVAVWLGNATEADRQAILLTAKQVSAQGQALRISFPSVMTFFLGFEAGRFQLCVPVMS
jgi:cell division inhibitor SulA